MKKTLLKRKERLPEIRLSITEKETIESEFKASFYTNKSEFIRTKLLDKTYSAYRQKQYEAEIIVGKLLPELNKIGANINQIAKRLNQLQEREIKKEELLVLVSAIKLIATVKDILIENTENDSQF